MNIIIELRNKTGNSLMQCKKALQLFDNNIKLAAEYLRIRSQAVCRRRPEGTLWQEEDYVKEVKNKKESE
jgi:translation elongation factor EF-Ts